MDRYIYGVDTETHHGRPMTLQFYSEDIACNQIVWVHERDATKKFVAFCDARRRKCEHVLYIHNLKFDLTELFWLHKRKLVINTGGDYEFSIGRWSVSGVFGSPTFCRMSDGHGTSIVVVDSFSFFRGSLERAAELFCPDLPKLRRPPDLGEKRFSPRDSAFCAYAMRDAEVSYHIGRNIEAMQREFDIVQTVSVADFASRIFRHSFLDYTICQPSAKIVAASVCAYHGGKNNVTVPRGWYENVSSLDISSAYPDAMHGLPAFSNSRLFKRYGRATRPVEVPEHGVYRVAGRVASCPYPVLFTHAFKPISGNVSDVWVQGYELNEALRSGEFKPSRVTGWFYESDRDNQAPALRNFVADFYRRKETEKDKVKRFMYKLILNSLSGKFIQTRKMGARDAMMLDDNEVLEGGEWIAGGMFHPFIAAAITAHTRARIHQLEHKYNALHTATDGIFTQTPVSKLAFPRKASALGAISNEGTGELCLFRNKLYILYSKTGEIQSAHRGKRILKYARHGYQGTLRDLESMASTGRRRYSATRPNQLRESIKRGLVPNEFVRREYILKVGPLPVRGK